MKPDPVPTETAGHPDYSVAASISRTVVQLLSRYTGRGPTRVRTSLNTNFALVVLEDALTKGEQSLVAAGNHTAVRRQREAFQALVQDEAIATVEQATGRTVRACMSDVSTESGIAIELFLFEPVRETGEAVVAETNAPRDSDP